jgi:ribose/xylose/arabinose/galactoside ABC-type transport system permease subunit
MIGASMFPNVGNSPERSNQIMLWLLDNLIWPIVLLAFVIFSVLLPGVFSSAQNIQFLLFSSAALGMLVLAESLCLLSGNFDLSIGSIAGFSGMFTALFLSEWFPWVPGEVGILIILLVGATIGLGNGVAIGYFGINPFLQTLAFFIIFRGAITILSSLSVAPLPGTYTFLGGATIAAIPGLNSLGPLSNVPVAILVLVGLYAVAWYVLNYTRFGLAIYAVGGDATSAKEAGIPTERVIVAVFVISGTLSALAGLLFTGYLRAATPTLARGDLFPAFAAAVIGGISLFGGRGDVKNAFGGLMLISMIQIGLVQLGVDAEQIQFVNGVVLLGAIYLYAVESRLRARVLSE